MEHNSKHNIVTAELEQVKKIEIEIASHDNDVLQKRLEQGRLLASLKNNTQGIEAWEKWRAQQILRFSRKTADNYISLGTVVRRPFRRWEGRQGGASGRDPAERRAVRISP